MKIYMDKKNFAFDKRSYILLAVGMVIVVVGFILMSGAGSSETVFNPDIFSVRRIKVAPVVCLVGYLFIIYAILHKPAGVSPTEKSEGVGKENEMTEQSQEPTYKN